MEKQPTEARGPIAYMARNHVASNILMMILLVGGLFVAASIQQEVFPEFELDMVSIQVLYPGATPSEVEDGIIRPIELAVSGINDVKKVRATARENVGSVSLEVLEGGDVDQVLADAKSEVDRIQTFPEQAEKPVISKITNRREVMTLMVYGSASERALVERAEQVRDDLLAVEGITQVELAAYRPYEISVEMDEATLRKYGLTLGGVARIIRASSLDLAGGTIRTEGGQVLIRTTEKRYTGAQFDSISVITRPTGELVRLGEIATVIDGFAEIEQSARFDGEKAVMVRVFRVGEQRPADIAELVRDFVEDRNAEFPPSVQLAIWQDQSELLQSRLNLLLKNGAIGLALVLVILAMFLELRLAFWVAAGIAISFAGSLIILDFWGASINMISLFGFLIILGVAVDDAIVVGENIYVHRGMGKSLQRASIEGTREIVMAVTFAGLTTIAAFGPLLFVGGFVGKFMWVVPAVVIAVLVVSLIEAFFVLPSHLSSGLVKSQAPIWGKIEAQRKRIDRFVDWLIEKSYAGTLLWAKKNRYTTLAIAVAILLVTLGVVGGGMVKFVFMPEVEADEVTVNLTMPPGTPYAVTRQIAQSITREGQLLIEEYDEQRSEPGSNLKHLYTLIGQQVTMGGPEGISTQSASNLAQIILLLDDPESRNVNPTSFASEWSDRVGQVPGVERLTFSSELISAAPDIEIQLSHPDYAVLLPAVERLKGALEEFSGAREVADSHTEGKREIKVRLKPAASTLGISELELAQQVRAAFFGAEALRIQRGQNEVKVMVRYPEEDRRSLATIDEMRIRTPSGGAIPFRQAAVLDEGRGYSDIQRADRRRVVNVTARVDRQEANAEEILATLQSGIIPQLLADYPGLAVDLEGESRDRRESFSSIMAAFGVGILLIYALLAIPFRSFVQPFIVMSAIPFGIVGAIGGHLLLGYSISMMSLFGIVALTGVVVNASLVMIDFINKERRAGADVVPAIMEAGKRRFRPIVMTALTTFFGLAPMILETSVQARFLVPMAVALGFGVLFATFITLVLVPTLYLIFEDIRHLFTEGRLLDVDYDSVQEVEAQRVEGE